MDNQVLTSDDKETICPKTGGNDGCSKTEKSWNHVTEAAECLLQVSTNPLKEKLAHCDVSTKKSTCNCLPVHLNGLIHNHVDNKSQKITPEGSGDVETSSSTLDLHNQSSVTASEHKCGNNCDYRTTQKPSDQETSSVSTNKEEELLAGVSALSVKNSSHDLDILEGIQYVVYQSEHQMPGIMRLITKDLSEPYSIYTYRYFIHNWPKLCFLAMHEDRCVGAIVCKLDLHKKVIRRGYIAMLAVDQEYRRKKIGSHLVLKAIRAMTEDECDEVVLETEITNRGALHLYKKLGFVRDKRLFRYYLNGVDALRLKLWLS